MGYHRRCTSLPVYSQAVRSSYGGGWHEPGRQAESTAHGRGGLTIAVAESCTGGLISSRITDVAGASVYFQAGLVTYSNEAKESLLSVPRDADRGEGGGERGSGRQRWPKESVAQRRRT